MKKSKRDPISGRWSKGLVCLLTVLLCVGMLPGTLYAREGSDQKPAESGTGFGGNASSRKGRTAAGRLSDIWKQKVGQKNSGNDNSKTQDPVQLSADDIERMNNGDVTMLFDENGYLTFLRGRYYDRPVTNVEEGIESLFGMAALLGLTKGAEFFGVFAETNKYGYTYYTYKQRYGDLTIQNAVLKVIVGPDGYTAGLISSFTPNVGFAPEGEPSITSQEAAQIVRDHFPEYEFTFYLDAARQTSVTIDGIARHAWAIFTDYPSGEHPVEGRAFLQHLVGYDGTYYTYMAVSSPQELIPGDNVQEELALAWFEGKEAATYTGTVTLHDGSTRQITVPVVYDTEEGVFCLADLERHILLSDYRTYATSFDYAPFTSADNTGWPDRYLLTYETYIKVYDFFAQYGMRSVDGFGMPILILTDYCDSWGLPIDNACYLGVNVGWALFAASQANDFGECLDVIGHEFTHGITSYSMAGDIYENEPGALNEALSDILGNLCEMLTGETDDTQWLLGEKCGRVVRSMSFPWLYRQPVTVGGDFYQELSGNPSINDDFGGVHTNSSLVGHLAWELCAAGMDLEDAFLLWREATNLLTPYSGFREIHHALIFACEIRQMDVEWMGMIDMVCEQAGF